MAEEQRDMRTAAQWERAHRHVRAGQLDKGEVRRWRNVGGYHSAVYYSEEQTRPWSKRDEAHARRLRREEDRAREEKKAAEALRREVQNARAWATRDAQVGDVEECWGGWPEGVGWDDVRPHTAYQWVALGLVPIAEARWGRTGPAEDYFYCSPWDVRPDAERARRLMATAPREYDRLPDGRPYDGRPWW